MTDLSHDCEQIILLLDSYHDGESSPDERALVDSHLVSCADCRQQLNAIGTLVATLKKMPEMKPTVDFADRVEQLLLGSEQKAPVSKGESKKGQAAEEGKVARFGRTAWLSAAAAVALLALLATQFFMKTPTINVASDSSVGDAAQKSKLDKNQVAAAVGDNNSQVPPRKGEQSAHVVKSEKINLNDQTSPSRKIPVPKVRIAEEEDTTNNHKQVLDVAIKADNVEAPQAKASQAGGNMVANNESQDNNQTQSLVAFSEPDSNNIAEELGITTDEDGLYAIKL